MYNWSIHPGAYRFAHDREAQHTLRVTNRRTRGGYGPVEWVVFGVNGPLASGEVWQGTRYAALVRQAMYDAETAAMSLVCDDCGRSDGTHDFAVEH